MRKRPCAATASLLARAVIVVLLWTTVSCRGFETGGGGAGRRTPTRDVIVITIDTLRADRVGIAGGPPGVTPGLDELGRGGALFLDATAHAPLTLPSHSSIFTGRYPPGHGVHDNGGFVLAPSVPTLAGVLHDAGYHTAAFVSSFVLRGSTGLAHGFDLYDDRFEGIGRAHQTASALERRGPEVAREAARWLAAAPRPYLLWVHFYDPHAPYDPPAAFAAKFPGRPYDAEVATSDFGVSTLLQALPADRRADTLVVATGDHGESLGEHGESEHGILLYDATLHVPLIMAGPGIPAGVRVPRQVRHVDLLPTIAELLGVRAPDGIDGVSLVPLLSTSNGHPIPIRSTSDRHPSDIRSTSDRHPSDIRSTSDGHPSDIRSTLDAHSVQKVPVDAPVSYAESRFGELHFRWAPLRSVRDGTWKYIDGPDPELFQLTTDPGERENRREARVETAAGMARVLGDLVARGRSPSSAPAKADADAAERLRSLGYVTGRVDVARPGTQSPRNTQNSQSSPSIGSAFGSPGADPKSQIARYEAYVKAFNDGLASLETGRARHAEAIFGRLAHEFPLAFEPHQYLARALTARRALTDAIAEFELAIRLSPREPVLYFDEARALADGGQFDRAFARVADGRTLEPSSFYGALTEGLVARAAGQTARAERALQESIRVNPALAVAHLELGEMAESRGDRDTARREYQRALDGDATLAAARQALDRMGR